MSDPRTNVVLEAYGALNRGDLDGLFALAVDDVVFDWSRSIGPFAGVYTGRDEICSGWADVLEAFEHLAFEPEEIAVHGEDVLVMVRVSLRGRDSGAPVVARGPHVWTVRDGAIARFRLFQEHAEAQAAVAASTDAP